MNGVMLLVLLGVAAYIVCVRLSPMQMRYWADYLNSRADAEDFWKQRFDRYKEQRVQEIH